MMYELIVDDLGLGLPLDTDHGQRLLSSIRARVQGINIVEGMIQTCCKDLTILVHRTGYEVISVHETNKSFPFHFYKNSPDHHCLTFPAANASSATSNTCIMVKDPWQTGGLERSRKIRICLMHDQ